MTTKILVVDDEKDMTRLLKRSLEPEIDCIVSMVFSGKMAVSLLEQESFDLVICDIKMPGMDGFELLEHIKESFPELTVVMLTAYGNIESAVKAIKKGAYDFISKPFELDEIIFKIKNALERSILLKENKRLSKDKKSVSPHIIGSSEAMQVVFDKIHMVASSDVTVLITGESGTGKDLVARSIHALSPRKNSPYIPVNCPAIPENILESELFGYKKGAFTNASVSREGLFQEANKGTIFLDEIGDIGPTIQTKLLRVLQEREIKPLGDNRTINVDVRIIASTNRDLRQKIIDNEFREDFFYRLNVLSIELPPLRERITDIPLLCDHLLEKHCKKLKKEPKDLSDEALSKLMKYSWPGNIRELENTIVQGILYSSGKIISENDVVISKGVEHLPDASIHHNKSLGEMSYRDAKEKVLNEFSHDYIGAKLSMHKGNVTRTAKECGMDRQALQQIMKRFGISPDDFR